MLSDRPPSVFNKLDPAYEINKIKRIIYTKLFQIKHFPPMGNIDLTCCISMQICCGFLSINSHSIKS